MLTWLLVLCLATNGRANAADRVDLNYLVAHLDGVGIGCTTSGAQILGTSTNPATKSETVYLSLCGGNSWWLAYCTEMTSRKWFCQYSHVSGASIVNSQNVPGGR